MWRPCLITDQDKISHRYRGPSIDASYQVSVHLAKRFQRWICVSSANQKHELPVVAMFVNGSGHNEQSVYRTFHRCFLSNSKNKNPVLLSEGFQRRRLKCEKLADDKWWQKLSIEKLTKSWKLNLCNKNKIEIKVIVLVQEWLVQYKYQIPLKYLW